MNHRRVFVLSLLLIGSFMVLPSYAEISAGPVVPSGNSTLQKYCANGICSTSLTTAAYLNATMGFFAYGNYSNGIHLNNSTLISIQLSKTCIDLETHGIPSNCPGYNVYQFLDTTNPKYMGQWTNHTGFYHKLPPISRQSWNFVTNASFVVSVDPDSDFTTRAKTITINDGHITYTNPDQIVSNHLRSEYYDRFVSADCSNAIISGYKDNPKFSAWLANDTVHYLESGCTETKYDGHQNFITPYHPIYYYTKNTIQINWLSHFYNGSYVPYCLSKCSVMTDPFHTHDSKFDW